MIFPFPLTLLARACGGGLHCVPLPLMPAPFLPRRLPPIVVAHATQGSTLGLLSRTTLGTWSLSPLKVVLRRERTLPVPRDEDGSCGGRRGSSRSNSSRSSRSSRSRKKSSRRTRESSSSSSRKRRGRGKASSRRRMEEDVDEPEDDESAPGESHRQV